MIIMFDYKTYFHENNEFFISKKQKSDYEYRKKLIAVSDRWRFSNLKLQRLEIEDKLVNSYEYRQTSWTWWSFVNVN